MARKKQTAANKEIERMSKQLEAGLTVLTPEQADEIIGEPGPGYKELLEAVQAQHAMLFPMLISRGLKNNPGSRMTLAKSQSMILQLVHHAYALGVQKGRGDAPTNTEQ